MKFGGGPNTAENSDFQYSRRSGRSRVVSLCGGGTDILVNTTGASVLVKAGRMLGRGDSQLADG